MYWSFICLHRETGAKHKTTRLEGLRRGPAGVYQLSAGAQQAARHAVLGSFQSALKQKKYVSEFNWNWNEGSHRTDHAGIGTGKVHAENRHDVHHEAMDGIDGIGARHVLKLD